MLDYSSGDITRQIKMMNGQMVVARTEDFSDALKAAAHKREIAGKVSDSAFIGENPYVLPNSLAEYLCDHGINGFNPNLEEFNFIHDWLKEKYPAFLVYPKKNMKLGNGAKARPTKEMF